MEYVSFEVAKAIKGAGYPQDNSDYLYDANGAFAGRLDYESWGISTWDKIAKPTYLEVWLWLWREKKISIDAEFIPIGTGGWGNFVFGKRVFTNGQYQADPEEAIIEAIEYIVDNNLLK